MLCLCMAPTACQEEWLYPGWLLGFSGGACAQYLWYIYMCTYPICPLGVSSLTICLQNQLTICKINIAGGFCRKELNEIQMSSSSAYTFLYWVVMPLFASSLDF